MNDRSNLISVDIGGSTCKIGLVGNEGTVREFKKQSTEDLRDWGPEGFAARLKPLRDEYSVEGVALGIPAIVDWDHNNVRGQCSEVPWLEDSHSKKILQDELGRPILLVNDVEALLVGEWIWGELKGLNSGVVLSLGSSMGSALLWNGEPQQGRRGSIMDVEHMSLDTYGETRESIPPGSCALWLSGSGLRERMQNETEVIEMPEFFRTENDPYVEIRETFEDKLAHFLGNIVQMLDPERIVLAGGLTLSHKKWLPRVKDKMDQFVMEEYRGVPSVVLAGLRNEEVIKGPAAFWDWDRKE